MVPALSESISHLLSRTPDQSVLCREIALLLPTFLPQAHLLPEDLRRPEPTGYRRSLLHEDAHGRFSIGCFVWSPGQRTPIHDHTGWGVVGVAAGVLRETSYRLDQGQPVPSSSLRIDRGDCVWCLPAENDIHRIGAEDQAAMSIHIYGAPFAKVCRTLYSPKETPS
jgi:predicted metal-dependent enzyme (double-stranded beta helix superfamily)